MSGTVLHFLTETDSFSDVHGAALQRWVANVLRFEDAPALVACARADSSWGLAHVKPLRLPRLWAYSKLKGRYRLPWSLRRPMLRQILRPALAGLEPDSVVWVHNRPDYAAAIEADVRAAGARLVVHLHNSLAALSTRKITDSFRADRVVFCSRYLESEARRLCPELGRTSVIHNGADGSRFFPERWREERRVPVVLFAGRLVPEKGAHVFVEAMWLLRARGIHARGRLLGATGFGSTNAATAYSRSIMRDAAPNVEFGGYRHASALADEFRAADIFCSPSVWEEPFGLVNVEAMASGLPVVSTYGGGVPEVFSSGGGMLVERGSATELAAALEVLIRNAGRRRELAMAGYRSFQRNFTWRTVHRRYREVLASLDRPEAGLPKISGGLKTRTKLDQLEDYSCQASR
jgi:glycosyltransferase involved in cell wall biosynthesis